MPASRSLLSLGGLPLCSDRSVSAPLQTGPVVPGPHCGFTGAHQFQYSALVILLSEVFLADDNDNTNSLLETVLKEKLVIVPFI